MKRTYIVVNNSDNQATRRTGGNLFSIPQLSFGNLKSISTRTRIMENFCNGIPSKIFDLQLIVICHHVEGNKGRLFGSSRRILAKNKKKMGNAFKIRAIFMHPFQY